MAGQRGVAAAARGERPARAERARRRARASEARRGSSPSSGPSTSTIRCTGAPCRCCSASRTPTTELTPLLAGARRARRRRGHRRADGGAAPAAPARAQAAARARGGRGRAAARPAAGALEGARPDPRVRVSPATMPPAERRSPVAQLAEHPAVNRRVVGSSPTRGASFLASGPKLASVARRSGESFRKGRPGSHGAIPGYRQSWDRRARSSRPSLAPGRAQTRLPAAVAEVGARCGSRPATLVT